MSSESQEPTNDETPAVNEEEVKGGEPPAKKKRGASHQIIKDDYDDEEDEDGENNDDKLKQGFKRASDEVIAKRKIDKVKRSFGAPKPADTTTETDKEASSSSTEEAKEAAPASGSSNPFASTSFASSSSSTETAKKGFGFGSATGFGAASGSSNGSGFGAASTGSGFGNGSSGFGNGSSGFGGGFASVGTSGTSSGFGSSSGSGKTSGFTFGSKSTADGSPSKSLFGNPGSINFSLSKAPDAAKKEIEITKLPEKVELKTGEEDEIEIHSGRCKSFEWVLDMSSTTTNGTSADGSTGGDGKKTNPSVQSSTQFQAAISSSKSNGESEQRVTETKTADDTTKENGTVDSKASCASEKHRWTELGIGPVKILQSKSSPERLRLVQRRESSKMGPATKVILNIPVWRESSCERDRQALQYLRLKTMKEGKMCQYLLKFKDNSGAGYFYHHLAELIPMARKCFGDNSTE